MTVPTVSLVVWMSVGNDEGNIVSPAEALKYTSARQISQGLHYLPEEYR